MKPLNFVCAALFAVGYAALAQAEDICLAEVDKVIKGYLTGEGPGGAVLVVKDGKVVHCRGYGLANVKQGTKITPDTNFDLASVSKQMTAVCVLMLVEQEKLRLDDPVSKLLADYKLASPGRAVTVRDLLQHTSGLPDYTSDDWDGTDEEAAALDTAGHLKWLNRHEARGAPGKEYEYNNSNYALLSLIVERKSGQRFSQFLEQHIFRPLEMKNTRVLDRADLKIPAVATGYAVTKGRVRRSSDPSVITGDGNVFSSINDLARWDRGLREAKLVRAATLDQAFTAGKLDNGVRLEYGFGWEVMPDDNYGKWVGHSGSWAGTAAYISRYLDQKLTIVLLSNDENAELADMAVDIADAVLGE